MARISDAFACSIPIVVSHCDYLLLQVWRLDPAWWLFILCLSHSRRRRLLAASSARPTRRSCRGGAATCPHHLRERERSVDMHCLAALGLVRRYCSMSTEAVYVSLSTGIARHLYNHMCLVDFLARRAAILFSCCRTSGRSGRPSAPSCTVGVCGATGGRGTRRSKSGDVVSAGALLAIVFTLCQIFR